MGLGCGTLANAKHRQQMITGSSLCTVILVALPLVRRG
jgi:hypothetical protein